MYVLQNNANKIVNTQRLFQSHLAFGLFFFYCRLIHSTAESYADWEKMQLSIENYSQ